jgi:hypothetical protein
VPIGEVNKYHFIVLGLTQLGLEPTNYHAGGEKANYYTTDAFNVKMNNYYFILNVKSITIFGIFGPLAWKAVKERIPNINLNLYSCQRS